ncbi:class I SAM-dependent methyltransferase [Algiphilus sp.]|uniref:class I SAM-dependent methyltransferase n=1 Tax=Algiphilus sp. TaxID=1872431 RepID=UPI003B528F0D
MLTEEASIAQWQRALERRIAAGRKQLLCRAVGLHRKARLRICDATAGFGRDAALMAALGAEITLCERHPAVVDFLRAAIAALPQDIQQRLSLHPGDAREQLQSRQWDAVYLDPMYAPTRKHALPDAQAQQLRALVGHDTDADALLALARKAAHGRVVVKRALRAPPLAGTPPMESLRGNSVRFDLYNPLPDAKEAP